MESESRLTKVSDEEGFKFWLSKVKEKRAEHALVTKLDTTAVTVSTSAPVTTTSPISATVPVVSAIVSSDISTSFDVILSYNYSSAINYLDRTPDFRNLVKSNLHERRKRPIKNRICARDSRMVNQQRKHWIENHTTRVLWINGVAGIGKSMMSHLLTTKLPPEWFAAVFYCRHDDANKSSAVNVLKTVAFELSKKYEEYFAFLVVLSKTRRIVKEKQTCFAKDVLELLNIFIPNDEVRFYHPAAVVPYYSTFARYVVDRDGDYEIAGKFQKKWTPVSVNHGLDLDKICHEGQRTNFTNFLSSLHTKISSALLFYRLLCLWKIPDTRPVKSSGFIVGVWSVTLKFNGDDAKITFYDRCALSAVKVSKEFEDGIELQEEFCALVEFLLSGVCPHP
ncbi:hypothetical protein HK098_006315 [Nowakowskiella sp. JEL0407]|nr:hypothetical protein HK098_006315 [Nowakowskiella sp. JEL0407]